MQSKQFFGKYGNFYSIAAEPLSITSIQTAEQAAFNPYMQPCYKLLIRLSAVPDRVSKDSILLKQTT